MRLKFIGKWAFLIGLLVVVLASFISGYATVIALVLFLLGLIVGFLNISEKDINKFLLAAIALLTGGIASISAVSMLGIVSTYLDTILGGFVAFVGAAALVVAIKAIFETGKQ
jgi:uncharacterized membrane protein